MSANVLKIIALITMTLDHVGLVFFSTVQVDAHSGKNSFSNLCFHDCRGL